MPRYKIETMVQLRRTYEVEADSADEAENILVNDDEVGKYVTSEEEINEDVDDVSEIKQEAA